MMFDSTDTNMPEMWNFRHRQLLGAYAEGGEDRDDAL